MSWELQVSAELLMDYSGHSNQVEGGVAVGEMGEETRCSGGG